MTEARTPPAPRRDSIRDLLRRLGDDFIALIRSELRLAGGEVRENLAQASGSLLIVALGAMLVSVAMLCLLGAGVAWLAQSVGLVPAALIVAAVAIILGGMAIYTGIGRLKRTDLAPRRVAANLRRDAENLKGD
ncbi:MAG: phage holin family protein [Polymorphobacter sp.]